MYHKFHHNSGLPAQPLASKRLIVKTRRDVRVVEGARLESVCRGNSTVGSNPTLSASSLACGSLAGGSSALQASSGSLRSPLSARIHASDRFAFGSLSV